MRSTGARCRIVRCRSLQPHSLRCPPQIRSPTARNWKPQTCRSIGADVARSGSDRSVVSNGRYVAPRRRDSFSTREVRHVRVAVARLKPEGDELRGHVVERDRAIPRLVGQSRRLREVRRSGDRGCSIDRRKQRQIASRIVHRAAADGYREEVLVKPGAVVQHPARKGLLGMAVFVVVATRNRSWRLIRRIRIPGRP